MQTFKSGSARTLDPTNKNYAPELSTFGIIIEVNPHRSAMEGPHSRETAFMITVNLCAR